MVGDDRQFSQLLLLLTATAMEEAVKIGSNNSWHCCSSTFASVLCCCGKQSSMAAPSEDFRLLSILSEGPSPLDAIRLGWYTTCCKNRMFVKSTLSPNNAQWPVRWNQAEKVQVLPLSPCSLATVEMCLFKNGRTFYFKQLFLFFLFHLFFFQYFLLLITSRLCTYWIICKSHLSMEFVMRSANLSPWKVTVYHRVEARICTPLFDK